jgi:hypothetical protein
MNIFSEKWCRDEWRNLGFHYELDDDAKQWRITGSVTGLSSFVAVLRAYASDPNNDWISCHRNLGPHEYLEIGTWSSSIIDGHWIAGRLSDLLGLASRVEAWLDSAQNGDSLFVRAFFSPDSPHDVCLTVAPVAFDPSSLDASLAPRADG